MPCLCFREFALSVVAMSLLAPLSSGAEPARAGKSTAPRKDNALIGLGLASPASFPLVVWVVPDTPAARSGKIHRNNLVIAVGQGKEKPVSTEHMPIADALKMIRGPKGTVVTLKVLPEGKAMTDAITVSLTRGAFAEQSRFGDGNYPAPGTTAPRLKGQSLIPGAPDFELKETADQIVVLLFWGEWRYGSVEPTQIAQRVLEQYPEWADRVQLVAVSTDDDKKLAWQAFRERVLRNDDVTPVWAGPSVLKAFHIATVPAVYVLDPQLKVIAAGYPLELQPILKSALERIPAKNQARPKTNNAAPKSP